MSRLWISGAQVLGGERQDLLIVDGRLVDAAEGRGDAEIIDADGLIALPGLVDLHTHLREPGREDAETVESGTAAAARGGYTAIFAMANTSPVTDTEEAVRNVAELGVRAGNAFVQPIGAVTRGLGGTELAELGLMARGGVRMFSDDGSCVADPLIMRRALEYVRAFDGVIAQHAQDPRLAGPGACCHEGEISGRLGLGGWPAVAEASIIARDAQLAQLANSRLHVCHVTTAEGVDVLRWAKARGIDVTAEVTPHHLLLSTDEVTGYDPLYKVNPPLRPAEHIEALREALADGTIDVVATDHAPHARHDKEHAFADAAPGMLGLEQALGVVVETMVNTGRLSWAQVAEKMSVLPARIGRLAGFGTPLESGQPANLVLVDPSGRTTVDPSASASLSRNNPYAGRELPDPVVTTVYRGRVTHQRHS